MIHETKWRVANAVAIFHIPTTGDFLIGQGSYLAIRNQKSLRTNDGRAIKDNGGIRAVKLLDGNYPTSDSHSGFIEAVRNKFELRRREFYWCAGNI